MVFLLRGVLIGLCFGVPVGAVGAMTLQRTFAGGVRAGLLTGLGSSLADCLYAAVGAFGLTLISDFMLRHQSAIRMVGSALILAMGLLLLIRKPKTAETAAPPSAAKTSLVLSSFAVGITNPAAILTFLLAFSTFGIQGTLTTLEGALLVAGVFVGTTLWWGALSFTASVLRRKAGDRVLPRLNRLCGVLLIAFGVILAFRKG